MILNLACGAVRPQSPEWVNLDNLFPVLKEGTPERENLMAEPNYVEHDVLAAPLPLPDGHFDGVLCSHFLEHLECHKAIEVMRECRRVLKTGGVLLVSVPDASYFRSVYGLDTPENAVELFGEPIYEPDGEKTFTGYALWYSQHKVLFTSDVLWHYFKRAGFEVSGGGLTAMQSLTFLEMGKHLNRKQFSLIMVGSK